MEREGRTERIELLLLVRLAVPRKKRLTPGELRKDLWPLVAPFLTSAEWSELLSASLEHLVEQALLQEKPLVLTAQGKASVRQALKLSGPLTGSWRQLKAKLFSTLALGLDAEKDQQRLFGESKALQGEVLKRAHALPFSGAPTLNQARDALLWKQLGVDSREAFTLGRVRAHLLTKLLATRAGYTDRRLLELAVAQAAGSRDASNARVSNAVVRDWLRAERKARSNAQAKPALQKGSLVAEAGAVKTYNQTNEELTATELAKFVLSAAQSPSVRRYGTDKAFISSVWEQLREKRPFSFWSLDDFKQKLVEANQHGALALSRADLVPAMSPIDVETSETRYMNATFHFINTNTGEGR